jgi:glutathione S-transferase
MELVAIVTGIALLQVFFFAFQVGKKREEHGISAPAISGHPDFERAFRVHQNSVEQMVLFVPGLWLFGYYVDARIAAGIGVLFIIARQIYRGAYMGDPKNRGKGFGLGALCMVVLLLGGMIGAGMAYF